MSQMSGQGQFIKLDIILCGIRLVHSLQLDIVAKVNKVDISDIEFCDCILFNSFFLIFLEEQGGSSSSVCWLQEII